MSFLTWILAVHVPMPDFVVFPRIFSLSRALGYPLELCFRLNLNPFLKPRVNPDLHPYLGSSFDPSVDLDLHRIFILIFTYAFILTAISL